MTKPSTETTTLGPGRIESIRIGLARAGLFLVASLLVSGLVLFPLGYVDEATQVLQLATLTLIVLPIMGVVALLAEEASRRDWVFAGAALLVVVMLGLSLYRLWSGAPA